ncbi:MAG: 30S ribosomal protein S16 [Bacteroidota bacterium]|nr:30S ribosomal protein S16 [Candidatus Kapabacteria bacterium]MDW8220030.1 30S ribosomal protein S16 [Bacteroidota bacterium]
MVKIRLRRRGRKKAPVYDIVAMNSRKTRDGAFLEKLGQYNPMTFPSKITLNNERALYWLKTGAQPTAMARAILSYQGVLLQLHLERKGKSAEEIAQALQQHKEIVLKRLERKAQKRQNTLSKKKVAALESQKQEAVEAPAE